MPIFFYGKEFTNIGSIGIKDKKKKASRITNIKCKLGEGGRGWRLERSLRSLLHIPQKLQNQRLCNEWITI